MPDDITGLHKIAEMARRDMPVRLIPLSQVVEVKTAPGGGHITLGIPRSLVMEWLDGGDFVGGLLLVDRALYEAPLPEKED